MRRVSTPLILVALVALVVAGTVWAVNTLSAPFSGSGNDGSPGGDEIAACEVQQVPDGRLRPSMVTVTVQNAGNTVGLASKAAEDLESYNFTVSDVGNVEDDSITEVVVIGYSEESPEVQLVASQYAAPEIRGDDSFTDHNVHIIIGDDYPGRVEDAPGIFTMDDTEICLPPLPAEESDELPAAN